MAASLRQRFRDHGIYCCNLISSPGSGKTTLLERTLASFEPGTRVAVLTGDIQTDNDARRLARYGYPVRQITTAGACHLDARMIDRGLKGWPLEDLDYLLIENVGNLVCPTSYDLGEHQKIVLLSVTEGEDKPLKYPGIFHRAALMVLTKTDLLPYVPFQAELALENARTVNPNLDLLEVSCQSGAGITEWMEWLGRQRAAVAAALTPA
jgi:hydrogenase nickel incorporation protein HypB